ncbi:hypothetical protein DXB21_13260 [Bacteroides faecis]|nr:hypothetical protein HMPREF2815_17920 [Bacteroides sp. HMSC068A09]RGO31539.1 hypothetical protein DXB21_13260 [Bacteroides faecis]RGU15886.1 hypothetical protein DWW93_10280 [Bacteroides faecis]RYT91354.1 hypothetical protein EAJ04_04670 [Bacteroides faecis]
MGQSYNISSISEKENEKESLKIKTPTKNKRNFELFFLYMNQGIHDSNQIKKRIENEKGIS